MGRHSSLEIARQSQPAKFRFPRPRSATASSRIADSSSGGWIVETRKLLAFHRPYERAAMSNWPWRRASARRIA